MDSWQLEKMENIKATKIETSCIVHATEDLNMVKVALSNIFPSEMQEKVSFKQQKLEGHYGNPITILQAEINDIKLVESFLNNFSGALDDLRKMELSIEFKECLDDKGNLYIRLDKQAAFMNKLRLQQQDPIKIKIRIKKSKRLSKEQILDYYRRVGLFI